MVGFYLASEAVAIKDMCSQWKSWGLSILKFGQITIFTKEVL
jgi:hypothetical protein